MVMGGSTRPKVREGDFAGQGGEFGYADGDHIHKSYPISRRRTLLIVEQTI